MLSAPTVRHWDCFVLRDHGDTMRKGSRPLASSILVTLLGVAGIHLLLVERLVGFVDSAPLYLAIAAPLYLAVVAYCAFTWGPVLGLISAALTLLHAALFSSAVTGQVEIAALLTNVMAVTALFLILLITRLRRRAAQVVELSRTNMLLLVEAIERRRTEETARALASMGRSLIETRDSAQAREGVVTTALELFHVARAVLYERDPGDASLACIAAAGELDRDLWIGKTLPPHAGVAGRAVAERRLVCAPDALDPRLTPPEWLIERYQREGFPSSVGLPLRVRDKILGALTLDAPPDRVFPESECRLLSIFAGQVALALENAHLYESLQATLHDLRVSQQQVVHEERLRAVEDLAAGVAHHVNNRLMIILTTIQLVLPKIAEGEIRSFLETVERTTLDGADLVQKLVRFTQARAISGVATANLNQVVQEALEVTRVDEMAARLRGSSIDTSLELGSIPELVAGDPFLLQEAITNIIRNAVEALQTTGKITIKTWASGGSVFCSVADTGIGMSEEIRRRAEEPFFTTKGPQRRGLGLSSAYGIIHRHAGTMTIDSVQGRGTTVTIQLPQSPPTSSSRSRPESLEDPGQALGAETDTRPTKP